MARVMLLVGTRKGAFILESDEDRRDWTQRGPFCEAWPVYHVIFDPVSDSVFAAASSEWHGSAIWRSADRGESWTHSSEGLAFAEDSELRLSKVSGLAAAHGRLLAGTEAAGLFTSDDRGESFSLVTTLDGQPGRGDWNVPSNQPPGHLGMAGLLTHPVDPERFWVVVQGYGFFATEDAGLNWEPRNQGLRADWPIEDPAVGYCVHKLVMSPVDSDRLYQQNHCGMHRSDDGGKSWVEITEGLPSDFGFAAAAHPHDRDSFYVVPLDGGHDRCVPEGRLAVWRTEDAGESWRQLDRGLPSENAHVGVLREGMTVDSLESPGVYCGTSTGQLFASADEGETWSEIASYMPGITSVEVAVVD